MTNPNSATVNVYVNPGATPPYSFESNLLQGAILTFKNKGRPGFMISFVLANADQTGFYFPDDKSKALAAQKGTSNDGCPRQGTTWDVFSPVSVSPDNTMLVVNNTNPPGKSTDFSFSLFVTQEPHNPDATFLELDPIGSNQDGPISRFELISAPASTSVTILVVAVVIIVIALYAFNVFKF